MTLEPERVAEFPLLILGEYEITSQDTEEYNCVAWAVNDDSRWWQPSGAPHHYWPNDSYDDYSVEALITAYNSLGYETCENSNLEAGFEKIAVYATPDGEYAHASRQLPNGQWASKLGDWQDIDHLRVEALESASYGIVHTFLRHRIEGI